MILCVKMEKEGGPHTLAQGPSVTGSKGLALGMCLASLQGLEGDGDRVLKVRSFECVFVITTR